MNSKIFTLTTLLFLFIIKVSAQIPYAPIDNIADVDFLVTDGINGQHFVITSENEYYLPNDTNIIFRINLDNSSQENTIGYFGIQYKLTKLLADGSPGEIIRGITTPVLIPPVKKKKTISGLRPEEYPFLIHGEHILLNTKYKVEMNLVKYRSRYDYLNETNGYDALLPAISFNLNVILGNAISENSSNSFFISAYPNPSTDHVTIEHVNAATKNSTSHNTPLEVIIFNDKGRKVSNHSLTNLGKKKNKTSYNLDTTHLPKGMYFFQIRHEKGTFIKTIIKK